MREKLVFGLSVTGFAMGIVFVALAVLMVIVMFQSFALRERKKAEAEVEKKSDIKVVDTSIEPVTVSSASKEPSNDEEIVAAIMTAICAYTNLSSNEFRIKGIKRINGNDSLWRNTGIIQ